VDYDAPPADPDGRRACLKIAEAGHLWLSKDFRATADSATWKLQISNPINESWTAECDTKTLASDRNYYWQLASSAWVGVGPMHDLRAEPIISDPQNPDTIRVLLWTSKTALFTLHLVQGWNLVSTPVEPVDPNPEAIFPLSVASAVWEYNNPGGYTNPTAIAAKKGYWVLAPATKDVLIQGTRPIDRTIPVKVGWNLVGCVPESAGGTCALPPNPPILAVWGYNNPGGYVSPAQLDEGRGYWMMSSQDTTVASAASRGASSEPTAAAAGWPLTLQLFNGAAKFLAVECWTQAAIPQRDRHAHTSHGRCREALCRGRLLASPPPSLAGADGPRGSQASPSPCLGFPYRGKPATGSEAEICPGRSETETALDLAGIRSIMRGQ